MFKGYFCALITPFKDGKVDESAFQNLVEWQIAEGVHGLVPCGTTGESPTLSNKEHDRVIAMCIESVAGRIPVVAGAGTNSTSETVARARHAQETGAGRRSRGNAVLQQADAGRLCINISKPSTTRSTSQS